MSAQDSKRSLFEELRRRRVWRVATMYAASGFIAWQVADIAFPALGFSGKAMTWVVMLVIAGFPIAVALAWVFQVTDDGVRRTSQLDALEPGDAAAVRTPSRLGRLAFVATLSLAVLLGTWAAADRLSLLERTPEVSHTALAVLPFQVRGSESIRYLREGMVDMLSRAMDGVGDLRAVDPVRVTQVALEEDALDTRGAEGMARRIGAGQFVTGSINEVAGEIRMAASLYALQDSLVELSRSEVQGDTANLFALVDRLTGELLAGRSIGAASQGIVRGAALSTTSLGALKAFLEGETLLRRDQLDSAALSFTRAVEADPSFGTAYYRRAVAKGFHGDFAEARSSLDSALTRADGMSAHERRLAEAYRPWIDGDFETAERRYRAILQDYPEDLEAKVHLGNVLFAWNPVRAEPLSDARELFESVLAVDPRYQCTLCQLMDLARTDRDWDAYERYTKMANARDHGGDSTLHLSQSLFLARAREQSGEVERLLLVLDTVTNDTVLSRMHGTGHGVQVMFGDVRLQRRLLEARQQREQEYPEWDHAWEWLVVERTEGHMAKSLEYVRALGHLERDDHYPLVQMQPPYLVNFDPDVTIDREALEEVRDDLMRLPAGVLHHDSEEDEGVAEALFDPYRRLYLGLIQSRLGADSEAESEARAIDALAIESPAYAGILDLWARTIRADIAYRDGAWERVVELVDAPSAPVPIELFGAYSWEVLPLARVLHTDALLALGRNREAIRWLSYGPYNFYDAGLWLAFKSERRAHAYDAVGDVEAAAADYQRFVQTWIDADPELQPRVEAAKRRLAELRVGEGR